MGRRRRRRPHFPAATDVRCGFLFHHPQGLCYTFAMSLMIIAFLANVLVYGALGGLLAIKSPALRHLFGSNTPARGILASVYCAVALSSVLALIFSAYTIATATILFPIQIMFQVGSIFTTGKLGHPVVLAGLILSVLQAVALYQLL